MKNHSFICLVTAIATLSTVTLANAANSQYLPLDPVHIGNCKIMHWTVPSQQEKLSWSGGCKNGFAEGEGEAKFWYDNPKHGENHTITGLVKKGEFLYGQLRSGKKLYYEGSIFHGRMEGRGIFYFRNGDRIEGHFFGNKANGAGVLVRKDGTRHAGEFYNGFLTGPGEIQYSDGTVKQVVFSEGKVTSQAASPRKNKKSTSPQTSRVTNGTGTLRYDNGSVYEGPIVNNKPDGYGEYKRADGTRYKGRFKAGKMVGRIEMTYSDGTRYIGDVKNYLPNGKGVMRFQSGARVVGSFKDGEYNGNMQIFFADKRLFKAYYKNGEITRMGSYYNKKREHCLGYFDESFRLLEPGTLYAGHRKIGRCFMRNGELIFEYR